MNDIERKARALLAYECPECGGDNGHETEDGWLRCSRCSNPHDVTRNQAMQAIIAALTPPEGFVLVPMEPTNAMRAAGDEAENECKFAAEIYAAMVSARPEAP